MIVLRPMRDTEYPAYLDYFIPDYAAEISANYAQMRSAFICDFYIEPTFQGQGLGKQAMAAFEHKLKSQGISQIKLRVAGDNQRARRLYEATGFRVTGVNMSKNIPPD